MSLAHTVTPPEFPLIPSFNRAPASALLSSADACTSSSGVTSVTCIIEQADAGGGAPTAPSASVRRREPRLWTGRAALPHASPPGVASSPVSTLSIHLLAYRVCTSTVAQVCGPQFFLLQGTAQSLEMPINADKCREVDR